MSQNHQHQQQHYYDGHNNNGSSSADEMDAMLNSLVGAQPQSNNNNYNQHHAPPQHQGSSNYFNYYPPSNNNGPPPQVPPRQQTYLNDYSGVSGSNKYHYPTQQQQEDSYGYPPPPAHNNYGYPPASSNHTPLPQRVSSVTAESFAGQPIDSGTPYAMPQPYQYQQQNNQVYPPLQYHHQRNPSQGTASPPGSPQPPPMSFPNASQYGSSHYQIISGSSNSGYPAVIDPTTQDMISNSYRPTFTSHVSDSTTTLSTPSTISGNTPPAAGGYSTTSSARTSSTATMTPQPNMYNNSTQPHRRNPSSLRNNMIMTIERPRYDYLPDSINTDQLNENEMPFIPVSPDTDSDEDEYFSGSKRQPEVVHKVNEFSQQPDAHIYPPTRYESVATAPVPPPKNNNDYQITTPATPAPTAAIHQQEEQQHKGDSATYDDPTQFYVYPPVQEQHEYNTVPAPAPAPSSAAPALPRHQEPIASQQQEGEQVVPTASAEQKVQELNYGLLSVLSTAFIRNVKGLEHVRELWCASEYNESFTGSEAVTIIKGLLKDQVPEDFCVIVANALMRCKPALFTPTQYSQRSLISNTMYNSDDTYFLDEDIVAEEEPLPTGVIPSLTPCYSYACKPGQPGCYSDRCPNNGKDFIVDNKVEVTVSRNASAKSTSTPAGGWLMPHEAWAASMDREVLATLEHKEIGRQEVLNETMYSEEKYLSDLTILHEVIVQGLEKSGAIENDRLANFIQTVFNNYQELLQISEALFKDMLARYRENIGKCVPTIGDILIQHMQFFEKPYVTYSPQALLAKYLAEAEIKNNSEFDKFCKEVAKHERTDRLPIWHYLLSPVTRMQRYPLLIEALLKKTPQDHPDHVFLTRSYEIIRSVASKADNQAVHIKSRLAILHIRDSIIFRQGEYYDLMLDDPNRRLYHKGILKRRSGTLDVADKNDIFAFVFDHMVVMTKMRKTNTGEEYRVWKKPIPLQMLVVQSNASNVRYQMSGTASSYTIPGAGQVGNGVTLTLHHLGSRGGAVYPFFCSSMEEKQVWTKAIEDAKISMKKRHGDSDVFELRPLDDVNFRNIGSGQSTGTTTRINCSVPFLSAHNERKIAIGTDNGVFFKTEGQDNSVRRIIQSESVVQLAVMEKYHILIVLTEKSLRAYPIDVLDSKSNTKAIDRIEVEIAQHVNFFQIGFCNGRDMLVFKKKKNTTSVFTALEPFCDLRDPKNEKLLTQRPSIFSNRPDYLRWFKKYKDFYIGAEASNIHFLKAKLNIVCERGFEVIDPENLTVGRDIPDSEDPEFYFVTREPLKPLAMYRITDKFLLCYDKFAFYVNNRNGSLVARPDKRKPATICEWEGSPTHIVYEHPYIIAIDPYFIEIRHVDNGELVQIISGENIRLAYYNGGGDKPIIHVCMSHSQKPDTQALFHLVLNNHRNSIGGYSRRS